MIIATIFCSLVANYWSLVLSRALLGLCIGLNWSVGGLIYSEGASSYPVYNVGKIIANISGTLGAGWVAILAYLLLEKLRWRYFIVLTSIPWFLPPIFLVHCVLTEANNDEVSRTEQEEPDVIEVTGFKVRLLKGCIVNCISSLQGLGNILLIPAVLSYIDKDMDQSKQLLILALEFGGAKLLGRIFGVLLMKNIRFRVLQPTMAIIIASSYLAIVLKGDSLLVTVIALGIVNFCYIVTQFELNLMEFDKHFFGTEGLVLAVGLMAGSGMVGATIGAINAQFLSTPVAVKSTFVLSCIQIITFLCIHER